MTGALLSPDMLRYGELGLLALVLVMGYQMAMRVLREGLGALTDIGRGCHDHQTQREERLIEVIERSERNQERFISAVDELKSAIRSEYQPPPRRGGGGRR